MHHRSFALITALVVCFAGACDKKSDDGAAKGEAKADKPDKADGEDAKAPEDKPEAEAEKSAKQFDVKADKSGVLARTSAVLMTTDETAGDTALRGDLAELSHHAENISSDETLCKHTAELRKAAGEPEGDLQSCVIHLEHQIVILGPEVYAQMAQCIKDAKDTGDLVVCDAAEKQAVIEIHENKRGDGLSAEVCEELFAKFEKLAMDDAGEHAEFVKGVLEEVKPDVMTSCQEQGRQEEADCVAKAADMDELSACHSMF